MDVSVIFQEMIVICLLILVGYILFHRKMISEQCSADLSTLVVKVCNPALILVSALDGCHNLKMIRCLRDFCCPAACIWF